MNTDGRRLEFHIGVNLCPSVADTVRHENPAYADAKHVHVLARFPDYNPRHWIGRAKKRASHSVRQQGLRTEAGGLFAKRCRPEPIEDREHEVNAFKYIFEHVERGARVWRFDR